MLTFAAVLAAVSAVRPAPEPSRDVVVVTRDVPAGSRLTAADLAVAAVPSRWVAPGALSRPADADDRVTLGPLAAGEAVTATRLVGGDRSATAAGAATGPASGSGSGTGPTPGSASTAAIAGGSLANGLVAAPVRVADAGAVALVSAGDTIDVVAARDAEGGPQAQVVARGVRVLAVPRRASGSGGGLLAAGASEAGGGGTTLLLLAVPPPTALALARESVSGTLSLLLHDA